MTATLEASPRPGRSCGVFGHIAAAAAALAAAILYLPVLAGLISQWATDSDAAYGAVVAAAAGWLFLQRWPRVRSLPRRGANAGLALLAGACVIYMFGTLAADVFLVRVSLPLMALGSMLFIAGPQHVRGLAAPLALSCVAIPLPSALVTEITLPLQLMASQCAAAMLTAIGVPVVRDGNVLTLNYITLQVAEACSGMRSLVTLAALVAVYAAVRGLPLRRLAILAAATVPVALVGNGLRVAVTALLAARVGADATRGAMHDATGWFAFVLMGLALYAIGVGSESVRSLFGVGPESVQSGT